MYMLAFVTMIVALTGVYAQVLSLQTAHFYATQATVAQAMLAWHAVAVGDFHYAQLTNAGTTVGCNLTSKSNAAATLCTSPLAPPKTVTVDVTPVTLPVCTEQRINLGTACYMPPPTGYNFTYTFLSIAYTVGAQHYVITYVPPPAITAANPAPGFITLPGAGGTQIGIAMNDLLAQIENTGLASTSYGIVQTIGGVNVLSSGTLNPTGVVTYALPTVNAIPVNSIAIISSI